LLKALTNAAKCIVLAGIATCVLVGCSGSGVTEPEEYAPAPSASERVHVGKGEQGAVSKSRTFSDGR
jgi:hypothetical protein